MIDAIYDEYVQGRPAKGATGEDDSPWELSGEEVKRSGEGTSQEGMWFGPRLGRRRRRSTDGQQGSSASKHRPGALFWAEMEEAGGSPGAYLERRPDFDSILRGNREHRPSIDEEDMPPEEVDLFLYGDATETTGVGEEDRPSSVGGNRKRRQPEDAETKRGAVVTGGSGWGGGSSAPGRA
ncbi:uncharacterized protein [Hetaerina americana]|uniref:uncharacterized protein n=1 Tax=Hetaerina americana TaxID=62018 RepID=UPI003A7F3D93